MKNTTRHKAKPTPTLELARLKRQLLEMSARLHDEQKDKVISELRTSITSLASELALTVFNLKRETEARKSAEELAYKRFMSSLHSILPAPDGSAGKKEFYTCLESELWNSHMQSLYDSGKRIVVLSRTGQIKLIYENPNLQTVEPVLNHTPTNTAPVSAVDNSHSPVKCDYTFD